MPAESESPHLPQGLVGAFDEMTARLQLTDDLASTFAIVTEAAVRTIEGCQAASVSLLQKTGFVTRAATDPIAEKGDHIQYDAGEGPCLSAAVEQPLIYTPKLRDDQRWPRSASAIAGELGVGSMLAARLSYGPTREPALGALNLYSRNEEAFDEDDLLLTVLLASLTSVVTHHTQVEANLQKGLMTRQVIGEAVGILRAQNDVPREEAFAMLVTASTRMNLKLRIIAERLVDGTMSYLPESWVTPTPKDRPSR